MFGEIELLSGLNLAVTCVKSTTKCELYSLSQNGLNEALQHFPEMSCMMVDTAIGKLDKLLACVLHNSPIQSNPIKFKM